MESGPIVHFEISMMETLYLGAIFLFCLYGVAAGQIAFYYINYPDDHVGLKTFVAALFLVDTAKTVSAGSLLYGYIIVDHSSFGESSLPPSDTVVNVLGWTAVLMSQCFYLYSLDGLLRQRGKKTRTVVVLSGLALSLLGWSSYIGGVVRMYTASHSASDGLMRLLTSGCVQQAANVATDVYITVAHILILRGFRSILVYKSSGISVMLARIILYTASRGVLLTAVQLVEMATFIVDSTNDTYTSTAAMLPQSILYCNSVLVALNIRRHIRHMKKSSFHDLQLPSNGSY